MLLSLKAARVNVGLNRENAAKLIGISPSTLRNYEQGKHFPDVKTLKRIEEVYSVNYNDINFFTK